MEGKAVLFKEFGGVDAFPICLDTKDPDAIVQTVINIAPAFGGINLEDISAPRCFEIEERLKGALDIPVFHDDQHGTAVVTLAALMNATKLTGKELKDLHVLIVGLGAAGIAVAKILLRAGVTNVIGCDRQGVGVAVAAQDALVVPTVFDADRKGLAQIAKDAREVAAKVRDGKITPPELSGGTFTVSNLGMFGIRSFAAIINSPQAAILAVGAIEERPVVRDGEITTAHLMDVTLACDHRILYGADAAEFLARIRALLEEPLALAL